MRSSNAWLVSALVASMTSVASTASTASAHVGIPEGRAPFVSEDGELLGAGTTWGLVMKQPDGRWGRVCEEAIGQQPAFYHRLASGRILLGTPAGLLATDDGGCDYVQHTPVLEGRLLSSFAFGHQDPQRMFITTSSPDDNGVFRSTDGGLTWSATTLSGSPLAFRAVITDPTGQHVFATAIDLGAQTPAVFVSHDGGDSFAPLDPGFSPDTQFVVFVGYNARSDEVALVQITGAAETTLQLLQRDGAALRDVVTVSGIITDYAATKQHEFITINRQELRRRPLGEGEFTLVQDGPVRCLTRVAGDPRHLYGCGISFQRGHFLRTLDGVNFKPKLPFLDVYEHRCPAGTAAHEACAYLFVDAGPVGFSALELGPPPPPSCRSGAGAAPLALLLLLLLPVAYHSRARRPRRTMSCHASSCRYSSRSTPSR